MTPPPDEHGTGARVCVVSETNAEQMGECARADVQAAAATRMGATVSTLNGDLDSADRSVRDSVSMADVVLLNLDGLEKPLASLAGLAKSQGVTIALRAAQGRRLSRDLLCLADVLIVSERHAPALLGEPEVVFDENSAAHDEPRSLVQQLGVRTVVVTLGPRGAWFLHERSSRFVPAYVVSPADPSGAGSAFVGTFVARFAEHQIGGTIDESAVHDTACWACAAGALATTKPGLIDSLPSRSEVVARLRTIDG